MAITAVKSTQYANQVADPIVKTSPSDIGRMVSYAFEVAQGAAAGDDGSTVELIKLPAGRIKIMGVQLRRTALGASRVAKGGYMAYTKPDGTAVAADDDAIITAGQDFSAAGSAYYQSLPLGKAGLDLETRDGVVLNATITGGTIPANATFEGWVDVMHIG